MTLRIVMGSGHAVVKRNTTRTALNNIAWTRATFLRIAGYWIGFVQHLTEYNLLNTIIAGSCQMIVDSVISF
jgi:hypothetical protein